jgi:hypothetical protein
MSFEPDVSMDLSAIHTALTIDGGNLVLVLTDPFATVALEAPAGDGHPYAANEATRLAAIALQLAEMLNIRNGSRQPLINDPTTTPEGASDDDQTQSHQRREDAQPRGAGGHGQMPRRKRSRTRHRRQRSHDRRDDRRQTGHGPQPLNDN